MRFVLFIGFLGLVTAGCAGPFTLLPGNSTTGSIMITICGNSAHRAESVIGAMDGPPLGETGGPRIEPPKEVTVCVQIDNKGSAPVKVDRARFHLKMSYGVEDWVEDAADNKFIVPGGQQRQTRITFHYSKVLSGEDVKLEMDEVVSVGDKPVKMAPLMMRKQ